TIRAITGVIVGLTVGHIPSRHGSGQPVYAVIGIFGRVTEGGVDVVRVIVARHVPVVVGALRPSRRRLGASAGVRDTHIIIVHPAGIRGMGGGGSELDHPGLETRVVSVSFLHGGASRTHAAVQKRAHRPKGSVGNGCQVGRIRRVVHGACDLGDLPRAVDGVVDDESGGMQPTGYVPCQVIGI